MSEERKTVELAESRAIVYLPEDAVSATITAKVWNGEDVVTVAKELTFQELRKAFDDADENYLEDTDEFVLTDFGKRSAEEMGEIKGGSYA